MLPPVGAVLDAPPAQQDQLDRAGNPTSVKRQKAVQVAEGGQFLLLASSFASLPMKEHFLNFQGLLLENAEHFRKLSIDRKPLGMKSYP